jgi:hypothetical protein
MSRGRETSISQGRLSQEHNVSNPKSLWPGNATSYGSSGHVQASSNNSSRTLPAERSQVYRITSVPDTADVDSDGLDDFG